MSQLSEMWVQLGFIRWPLAFSAVAVGVLALWSAAKLFHPEARAELRTKAWVDATLFWGGFALVAGVLGTLIGVVVTSLSIEAAGEISTTLVWGGIRIALLSSAVGALILALSALAWFVLQLRWRLLWAREAAAGGV